MDARRYNLIVVAVPLVSLAFVAILNRTIDPYRLFSADPEAIHADRPALYANIRLHKAHQVKLQRPDALIMGTSKAIQGIPTDHPRFDGRRVYNLGMPLASMREQVFLLRHALANAPVKDVVLMADFLSFNVRARTDGPAAGFDPERLESAPGDRFRAWRDYPAALVSLDATRASLAALRADGHGPHRVLTGRGGRRDAEIRSRLTDGGHRSNTLEIERFFTDSVYRPLPHRVFAFTDERPGRPSVSPGAGAGAGAGADSFAEFATFLHTVHANGVRADIVIGPSHARLGELIRVAGLWPTYETWKRRLVETNEAVATALGREPVPLWDFTSPGAITTEPFPEAGDTTTRMRHHHEAVHVTRATGAKVLDRLSGEAPSGTAGDFGVRLDGDDIETVLASIRTGQAAFRARHPDQVRELEAIVGTTGSGVPPAEAMIAP